MSDTDTKPEILRSESCLLFHSWTKWEDVHIVGMSRGKEDKVSERLVQVKTCKRCNIKKYREETIWDARKNPV